MLSYGGSGGNATVSATYVGVQVSVAHQELEKWASKGRGEGKAGRAAAAGGNNGVTAIHGRLLQTRSPVGANRRNQSRVLGVDCRAGS